MIPGPGAILLLIVWPEFILLYTSSISSNITKFKALTVVGSSSVLFCLRVLAGDGLRRRGKPSSVKDCVEMNPYAEFGLPRRPALFKTPDQMNILSWNG